jgi:hypothetical protein
MSRRLLTHEQCVAKPDIDLRSAEENLWWFSSNLCGNAGYL